MLALKPPRAANDEDRTVRTLCREPAWQPHETAWLSAYAGYRRHGGDPWRVAPAAFPADVAARQRRLYESRASGGPLARMRRAIGLVCCAMCGSHHNGTLDHYLPKQDYPEFAILPSNLVPACSICNSGAKGRLHRGEDVGERFLHPYFDPDAGDAIWQVGIVPPYRAACFVPQPLPNLPAALARRVAFHLRSLLGDGFQDFAATQWARLPNALRIQTGPAPEADEARAELARELRRSCETAGVNGWRTALLRGVAADEQAAAHVFSCI